MNEIVPGGEPLWTEHNPHPYLGDAYDLDDDDPSKPVFVAEAKAAEFLDALERAWKFGDAIDWEMGAGPAMTMSPTDPVLDWMVLAIAERIAERSTFPREFQSAIAKRQSEGRLPS